MKMSRILIGAFVVVAVCQASGASSVTDDGAVVEESTDSVHVDYNPFTRIFRKITNKSDAPLPSPPVSRDKIFGEVNEATLFGIVRCRHYRGHPYEMKQWSVLKVPWFEIHNLRSPLFWNPDVPVDSDIWATDRDNPLIMTFRIDEPLFCLWDRLKIRPRRHSSKNSANLTEKITRVRILDSFIVSLFRQTKSSDGYCHTQWGKTMLGPIFAKKDTTDSDAIYILDSAIASLFVAERENDDKQLHVLRVLDGSASVYEERIEEGEVVRRGVLNCMGFSLFRKERLKDAPSCRKVLDLPILGPVWSSWEDPVDGKGHNAIAPRLLFWRNPSFAR